MFSLIPQASLEMFSQEHCLDLFNCVIGYHSKKRRTTIAKDKKERGKKE